MTSKHALRAVPEFMCPCEACERWHFLDENATRHHGFWVQQLWNRCSAWLRFAFLLCLAVPFFQPSHAVGQEPAAAPEAAPPSQADAAPPQAPSLPPPAPANFQNPIPAAELAFLKDYDGRMPDEIRKDKRFRRLEKLITPSTRYFYHHDMGLSDARDSVLDDAPAIPISVRDGRFAMVATAGGPDQHMSGRGFLWFDMQAGIGLGGIYFHPTNGEPTPTLAVYSKQLSDTFLGMGQLPPDFLEDLSQWALTARLRTISPVYFIPANGRKYALIHDEDYCAYPPGAPAPDRNDCEELNAEAADADMAAAYFMEQTHNAADATAFMLNPDQVAWLGLRDRSCVGPNGLACRVRFTRERTGRIMGHSMPAPRPVALPRGKSL